MLRLLDDEDVDAAEEVARRDPVSNVFVLSRVEAVGLDVRRLGAEVWGWFEGTELVSLCYAGANLVPVEAAPEAARGFGERARRQGRRCSSIVGPADAVAELWEVLAPAWGPARDVRTPQPVLAKIG